MANRRRFTNGLAAALCIGIAAMTFAQQKPSPEIPPAFERRARGKLKFPR